MHKTNCVADWQRYSGGLEKSAEEEVQRRLRRIQTKAEERIDEQRWL